MPYAPAKTMKLATYNIHSAVGTDGLASPDRILDVINEMNPDIVALQELASHNRPELNMLEYFASQTGLTPVAGLTLHTLESSYGNAVLTRLPVTGIRRIDLSVPGHESRGAIDLTLDWHGIRLHLVATHLGLRPRERRQQMRRLLQLFNTNSADIDVLMGDLNEWFL